MFNTDTDWREGGLRYCSILLSFTLRNVYTAERFDKKSVVSTPPAKKNGLISRVHRHLT